MNPRELQKFLWGEFYYSSANKKIYKVAPTASSRPMFVQFVMDPLVKEYNKLFTGDMLTNSAEYKQARTKIKELFSKWMPMEKGVLAMIVQHIPSPNLAQR